MMHRIRYAMTPLDEPPKLTGIVEVDEAYVGGKVRPRSLAECNAERTDLGRLPKRDNDKVPVMALVPARRRCTRHGGPNRDRR
jgi:hypothetical protein